MPKTFIIQILLSAAFYAVALTAHTSPGAAQAAASGKIVGRVVERNTNAPLPAEVGLAAYTTGNLLHRHAAATEQGEFVIDGLEAGKINLVTKLEGYASEQQSFTLAAGETKHVEFSLTKVKLVRGVVRGPSGKALHGARVRAVYAAAPPARGEVRTTYQWDTSETYSDETGSYVIGVHPDKEFVVEATHGNFLGTVSAPRRIKPGEKEPVVGLSLEGGVAVAGEVRDEAGNIIEGARVQLIELGNPREPQGFTSRELLHQRLRYTASAADGVFNFEQVRPTVTTLVVVHPGYKPFRQVVNLARRQTQAPLRVVLTVKK